ncbi:hypothetical protein HDU82_005002 [Entophlyctis luteolus]|nr:hypothetical protein HDU82_005002 [Entophlyctis luteolus]
MLTNFIQAGSYARVYGASVSSEESSKLAVKCVSKSGDCLLILCASYVISLKHFNITGLAIHELQNQYTEIKFLSRVSADESSFPNIVNLIATHETQDHIFLVMEKFDTDLLDAINSRIVCANGSFYDWDDMSEMKFTVKQVISQILDAVEACHKHGIYHQDIKPENILLKFGKNSDVTAYLSDFGLATEIPFPSTFGAGSVSYTSPESLRGLDDESEVQSGYSSELQDLWGISVVIFMLVTGFTPWYSARMSDSSYAEFQSWIQARQAARKKFGQVRTFPRSNLAIVHGLSSQMEDVFEKLFDADVKNREKISISDIRDWIENVDEFVDSSKFFGRTGVDLGSSILTEASEACVPVEQPVRSVARVKSWCSDFSEMDFSSVPVFDFDEPSLSVTRGVASPIPAQRSVGSFSSKLTALLISDHSAAPFSRVPNPPISSKKEEPHEQNPFISNTLHSEQNSGESMGCSVGAPKRKTRHDVSPQGSPHKHVSSNCGSGTAKHNVTDYKIVNTPAAPTTTPSPWKSRRVEMLKQQMQQQQQPREQIWQRGSGGRVFHKILSPLAAETKSLWKNNFLKEDDRIWRKPVHKTGFDAKKV